MANRAKTNGGWCFRFIGNAAAQGAGQRCKTLKRITYHESRASFRLDDSLFENGKLLLHLAQSHMRDRSAWFVKEINDGPGQAADQDDEKTERTDENGSRLGHSAKAMQHDLQDFFPEPNSGETDRQRRDRALYRHDGKEID